jgi:hypothetical protein
MVMDEALHPMRVVVMAGVLTKTLPYLLMGLRRGIERAFPLTGLISGACQREATVKPMVGEKCLNNMIPKVENILITIQTIIEDALFETELWGV